MAVQSINERCLRELHEHGGLPVYHAPARAPEKQDGGKRYTIFCQDARLSLRQPGADIPYVNLQN
eukprot:11094408-Lingulodinium_polyedra.AAC.1